jgi:hypothetical protein
MSPTPSTEKPAWVQLYEARRVNMEVEVRSPGRPPAPIPRRKVGMTLSQAELQELEVWQNRFSTLLRRKVSIGETVGILTRIGTTRYVRMAARLNPATLAELVEEMIG